MDYHPNALGRGRAHLEAKARDLQHLARCIHSPYVGALCVATTMEDLVGAVSLLYVLIRFCFFLSLLISSTAYLVLSVLSVFR